MWSAVPLVLPTALQIYDHKLNQSLLTPTLYPPYTPTPPTFYPTSSPILHTLSSDGGKEQLN